MPRLLLLAVAATMIVPSAASAAQFGELPFLPAGGSATCLRATGAPGELVRSSPAGARFIQVTAAGMIDSGGVPTGVARGDCPQVDARPSGAGVVAQAGSGLWAATRDPGAAWGAPAKLAADAARSAVAVADSGAAVVAWVEQAPGSFSVKAARRAPGGGFGAPVTLSSGRVPKTSFVTATVRAAIAAGGEAVVVWTKPPIDTKALLLPVQAAIAPAGAGFGAARTIGSTQPSASPALALAADGRALIATTNGKAVQVAERAPGAAFGAPADVAPAVDVYVTMPAVAIGAGGAAVVAWYSLLGQDVGAVSRTAAGPFGAPLAIAAPASIPGLGDGLRIVVGLFGTAGFGPLGAEGVDPDAQAGDLRAALTPDGRALLTWHRLLGSVAPRVATFPLGGGHLDRWPAGSQVRQASSVAPLLLADGTAAIAWTDNAESARDGRVHVALEGRPSPAAPAPPAVTLGRPLDAVVNPGQTLKLPVSCSAACEVRVDLPDGVSDPQYFSLSRAGRHVVAFEPQFGAIVPPHRSRLRVRLRYSTPGASSAVERIDTVKAPSLPSPRLPRVLGLKAVRHGDRVDVSWRSDVDAKADGFFALGGAERDFTKSAPLGGAEAARAGGRRYTARMRKAGKVRYVAVLASNETTIGDPVVVRVR